MSRKLRRREKEVARLIVGGLSNKQIAEQLHLGTHTVKQHLRNIYRNLGLENRTALAVWCLTLGKSEMD